MTVLNILCLTYFLTSRIVCEPCLCDIGHIMKMIKRCIISFY